MIYFLVKYFNKSFQETPKEVFKNNFKIFPGNMSLEIHEYFPKNFLEEFLLNRWKNSLKTQQEAHEEPLVEFFVEGVSGGITGTTLDKRIAG